MTARHKLIVYVMAILIGVVGQVALSITGYFYAPLAQILVLATCWIVVYWVAQERTITYENEVR